MDDQYLEICVSGEMEVPVQELWGLLANFGEVSWMQGITRVELQGEGVGMTRAIYAGGDDCVLEELEALDHDAQCIGYTITRNNPLPVADYHAQCTAIELGEKRSRLDWSCRFQPEGVDAATARAGVEGMYGVLISWVKTALEK